MIDFGLDMLFVGWLRFGLVGEYVYLLYVILYLRFVVRDDG